MFFGNQASLLAEKLLEQKLYSQKVVTELSQFEFSSSFVPNFPKNLHISIHLFKMYTNYVISSIHLFINEYKLPHSVYIFSQMYTN